MILAGCAKATHRDTGDDSGYHHEGESASGDAETSDGEESDGYTDTESVDRDAMNDDPDGGDVTAGDNDSGSSAACKSEMVNFAEVRVFERGRGELGGLSMREMHASINGVVTELGEGFVPSDVTIPYWQTEAADIQWIRIAANEDVEWVVLGKRLPYGFSVAKGSTISVRYAYVFGGWSPDRTALWIHVGDALAFYFGEAGEPSELELPQEVVVSRGETLCEVHDECGDYAIYALDVKLDGASVILDTDQRAPAGNYEVWHGRTAYELSSTTQCMDWYVADTTITIARRIALPVTAETSFRGTTYSTLRNLRLEVEDSDCKFTLAEVEQGISFNYRVVIESGDVGENAARQRIISRRAHFRRRSELLRMRHGPMCTNKSWALYPEGRNVSRRLRVGRA